MSNTQRAMIQVYLNNIRTKCDVIEKELKQDKPVQSCIIMTAEGIEQYATIIQIKAHKYDSILK